jgi:hypothetical protein
MTKSNIFRILLILPLFFFQGKMYAQDICDSVFISPDTIYLNQFSDTTVTIVITYTGQRDISYSACSFVFQDTTHITIKDYLYTNGVSGPFIFMGTWQQLVYKNPNIPAHTIIQAQLHIDHGPQIIDCYLPVTFIINSVMAIKDQPAELTFRIFPNPVRDRLHIVTNQGGCEISLYDLWGKKISEASGPVIDLSGLRQGIYVLIVRKGSKTVSKRVFKPGN